MRKLQVLALTACALSAVTTSLFGGGFFLQLGNPEASAEAHKLNAVVTILAAGCHDPATAKVTATAVGVVKGQRRTIPLKLERLSNAGMFALTQQWPKEGNWVIELSGENNGMATTTLVSATAAGVDRIHAKFNMGELNQADVEAMLQTR